MPPDESASHSTRSVSPAPTITWERMLDLLKAQNDFAKHIATLDTAAIVIIATLLDRFPATASSRSMVLFAFLGFGISLIGVVFYQINILAYHHQLMAPSPQYIETSEGAEDSIRRYLRRFYWSYAGSIAIMLIGFFVGVVAIMFFAIENFR